MAKQGRENVQKIGVDLDTFYLTHFFGGTQKLHWTRAGTPKSSRRLCMEAAIWSDQMLQNQDFNKQRITPPRLSIQTGYIIHPNL